MSQSAARAAIALAIGMAERGEIDPWDVDPIALIDCFLKELGTGTPRESLGDGDRHLPQSGQAFLWASMLVFLKAETLRHLEEGEEEGVADPDEDVAIAEVATERSLPLHLERHIRRRPIAVPRATKRRVTLAELIDQIQKLAIAWEQNPPRRAAKTRARVLPQREAARQIAQLAHQEDLTEIATRLEAFLNSVMPQLTRETDWLSLEQLIDWWSQKQGSPALTPREPEPEPESEPQCQARDRVGVFWALLLLSAQSKVELCQEEFYQDVQVRPLIGSPLATSNG